MPEPPKLLRVNFSGRLNHALGRRDGRRRQITFSDVLLEENRERLLRTFATKRRISPPGGGSESSLLSTVQNGGRWCEPPVSIREPRTGWKKSLEWKSACGSRNGIMNIAAPSVSGRTFDGQ